MIKLAIDLLWVRPGKVGGTEFYIRNLLDGFSELDDLYEIVLVTTKNNEKTFSCYLEDRRFSLIIAQIDNANIGKRIIWQQLFQNRMLRKNGIDHCFIPVYCRPFLNNKIKYINTIHDIQAHHYPQYHPFYEVWYSKICWWIDIYTSWRIIATTEWVKRDLLQHYRIKSDRIKVLSIPVVVDMENVAGFGELQENFRIEEKEYYYTVAQMIPHKNLDTLIDVFRVIDEKKIDIPCKLLISGIAGNASEQLIAKIDQYSLRDKIILTGFVDNRIRNGLYKYCKAFLFPSVFEGFGMPPVEAMAFNAPVITTERTSIPEVTQGKALYVKNPYSVEEWIECMKSSINTSEQFDIERYDKKKLAKKYLEYFESILQGLKD